MARLLSDLEELLGLVGDAVDAPLRHVELELAQVGLHLQPHLLLERDEVAQRVAELERRHRRRRRPTRHLRRRGRRRLCIKVGSFKHIHQSIHGSKEIRESSNAFHFTK